MPAVPLVPFFNSVLPAAPDGFQNVHPQQVGGAGPINPASFNVPNTGGVSVKTASYPVVASDCGLLLVYNSAAPGTFTLPSPPPFEQWQVSIANIGAGVLTISRNGLLIDVEAADLSLNQNQGVEIATDDSNYFTERGAGVTSAASVQFAYNESPAGARDGINPTFTLVNSPDPSAALQFFRNGLLLCQDLDYTLLGQVITMTPAPFDGDWLRAWYEFTATGGGSGSGTSTSPLIFSDSTSVSVAHGQNTFNLSPGVWDASGNVLSYDTLKLTDANDALLTFVGPPQSGTLILSPTVYQQTIAAGAGTTAIPFSLGSLNLIPVLYDAEIEVVGFDIFSITDSNNASLSVMDGFPGGSFQLISPVGAVSIPVPSGLTSITITHNRGATILRAALYDSTNKLIRFDNFGPIDSNTSTLTLAIPLSSPGRIVLAKP